MSAVSMVALTSACSEDIDGPDGHAFDEPDYPSERSSSGQGDAYAATLGLAEDHDCGGQLVKYQPTAKAKKTKVFAGNELPWHDWRKCLLSFSDALATLPPDSKTDDVLYNQVLYLLSEHRVKLYKADKNKRKKLDAVLDGKGRVKLSTFDRLVETNEHGLAYSAMDQVDMGIALLDIHRTMVERGLQDDERTKAYRALGLAALDVVTDTTDHDGLRESKDCEKKPGQRCAWLHAKTNTGGKDSREGGTLNKHLFAAKYLHRAADLLDDLDALQPDPANAEIAARYRKIWAQAMRQMVFSSSGDSGSKLPNLMDYVVDHKGKATKNSWLYYGRNVLERRPYHLDNEDKFYKNCNYHILVLRLLADHLQWMQKEGEDIDGFTATHERFGDRSIVDFLIDVYEHKQDLGLYKKSKAKGGGNFWACSHTEARELEPEVIEYLRGL